MGDLPRFFGDLFSTVVPIVHASLFRGPLPRQRMATDAIILVFVEMGLLWCRSLFISSPQKPQPFMHGCGAHLLLAFTEAQGPIL